MNQNKIALIIGASSESIIAIRHAKALGLKVIAFDANSKAPGLKEADISYNIDIINPNNIIQTLSKENITPDIILPVPIGRYLITIGALNDYYNLNGFSYKMADICTDKLKFTKALNFEIGGGCKHIKSLRDSNSSLFKLDLDLNQLKFLLIIKPRFGSGSRDVLVITTDNELKEIYKNDKFTKEDFLIKEFINGIKYELDAVVIGRKYHHILIREKQITHLPYRQAIANISIDEIPAINTLYMAMEKRLTKIHL